MKNGKANDVLESTLSALASYTRHHFAYEEDLLKKAAFPEYEAHCLEHRILLEEVQKIQNRFKKGESVVSTDLFNFLKKWLVDHIKGTDMKYSSHI